MKFKNGKEIKQAVAIKPMHAIAWLAKYDKEIAVLGDKQPYNVTIVAATRKRLYTEHGKGFDWHSCTIDGHTVSSKDLQFVDAMPHWMHPYNSKRSECKRWLKEMQCIQRQHDDNTEITEMLRTAEQSYLHDKLDDAYSIIEHTYKQIFNSYAATNLSWC